jgi:MFS family permease
MTDIDRRVAGSRSAFRSFAFVNYRLWFTGATVSNVGTWMQRTAQDWIVLTMLTTNDATALGVTMALQFGPQLVLAPLTGYVVDLMDRRRLLMITQAAQGALALGLGILTVTGAVQLWSVFVFALLLGVVTAFDAPARQTFVSELVPPPYLSNAVGLNATSFNTARLIGPAIAGVLTAVVGAGWVFLLNAVTFAATLVALALLRRDQLTPRIRPPAGAGGFRDGFRYIAARPDLRFVLLTVFLMGTLGLNFALFTSTMTSIAFDEGAGAFGVLTSVLAIGSVAGALLAARRERPRMRNIALASAGFGLVMLVSAVMPTYLSFAIVLPFIGICSITVLNNSNAYTQMSTPPHLRGRVMSLYMAVVMGGTPLGALVMGWVVDGFGPRWAIVLGALGGILPALLAGLWWLSMRRAARDRAA